MAITINKQSFFSEVGRRANNEDNGGWNEGTVYIVCDGVGGNERGEIASDIITNTLLKIYKENLSTPVNLALQNVETKLTEYIAGNPESMGMASTLVLAIVQPKGILTAWVGDSRIYQFRNGKIIFKTTDHSWVNEALSAGILTAEEAVNHPKSNVITRAIQGSHKAVEAQEVWLSDLQKDDLFLLCSDGVLESWSDEDLMVLFSNMNDVDSLANKIKEECLQTSKDNNTSIVFKIEKVDGKDEAIPSGLQQEKSIPASDNTKPQKHYRKYKILSLLLLLIVLVFALSKVLLKDDKDPVKPNNKIPKKEAETKPKGAVVIKKEVSVTNNDNYLTGTFNNDLGHFISSLFNLSETGINKTT